MIATALAICAWCSSAVGDVDKAGACVDCVKAMTPAPPKPMRFPVLCGWCDERIGFSTVEHSTGMCPRCLDRLYPED